MDTERFFSWWLSFCTFSQIIGGKGLFIVKYYLCPGAGIGRPSFALEAAHRLVQPRLPRGATAGRKWYLHLTVVINKFFC